MDPTEKLVGKLLREVIRAEHSWQLKFDDDYVLNVECEWRLVEAGRVIVARGDDGQLFGLQQPCDVLAVLEKQIIGRPLEQIGKGLCNADLILRFPGRTEFQILADSGGYEAWIFGGPSPGEMVVGRGCD